MTNTVRGAGRNAAAMRRRKSDRAEQRLAELKRDQATGVLPPHPRDRGKNVPKSSSKPKNPKVQSFATSAVVAGWAVEHSVDDAGEHLTCTRDKEVLTIFWLDGVFQRWAQHTYGGGAPQRVSNAASGLRILDAKPHEAAAAANKKAAGKRQQQPRKARTRTSAADSGETLTVKESFEQALSERAPMAWEEQEMNEDEILQFLSGRTLSWVNSMTGGITAARVPKDGNHNKMEHGSNGLYISFASMEGPFMAVYLSNIISVS